MKVPTDPHNVSLLYSSLVYKIGAILRATESRNMEYKAGGGNYPLTVLPSVC